MSGPHGVHRHVRALAAPLLASLLAGLMPLPAAGVAATQRDVRVVAEPATVSRTTPSRAGQPTPDATSPVDAAPGQDAPEQRPSVAYEEAMAHEHDVIAFQPGGLVDVGFKPRGTDRWSIDGQAPSALPPGRATGRQMAASPQGSRWADIGPGKASPHAKDQGDAPGTGDAVDPAASPAPSDAPIDAPAGEPAVAASGASFVEQADPGFDLAAAAGLRRQVFGFLPYWEVSGASSKLNYDVLSTIAYFSVGATGSGNLKKKDADGTSTT